MKYGVLIKVTHFLAAVALQNAANLSELTINVDLIRGAGATNIVVLLIYLLTSNNLCYTNAFFVDLINYQ